MPKKREKSRSHIFHMLHVQYAQLYNLTQELFMCMGALGTTILVQLSGNDISPAPYHNNIFIPGRRTLSLGNLQKLEPHCS
jgi:hypothetical protein